jgi:antitoxin MazE
MKTRLISIGNSKGVRLPKPLILQAGLTDEVELQVQDGAIVITRAVSRRAGWAEAAQELHRREEDRLMEPLTPTSFDEKEWEW